MALYFETKITLRLPQKIHSALTRAAEAEKKSLNQEIVDRLNRSLGNIYVSGSEANEQNVIERIGDLERRVAMLEKSAGKPSLADSLSKLPKLPKQEP
jgi:uncharacterized protein (DUF2164 family)